MFDHKATVKLDLLALILFGGCCFLAPVSFGQQITTDPQTAAALNSFTAIHGNYDQEVSTPQFVMLSTWRQDGEALKEINAFRALTGTQNWNDMAGQGTIRYGNNQSAEEQASLEIRQPGQYRLDTGINGSEQKTMRIAQSYGAWQRGNSSPRGMDARDAAAGFFAFPRLEEHGFPDTSDILIDQGLVSVEGHTYHRITLESPPLAAGNANDFASWATLDLYFDPQTHLLEKSASSVHGGEGTQAIMLRVFTYGEYQKVNGTSFPMKYRETLNGQLAWTLQLTEIHLNNGVSAQDFHF